MVFDTVHTTIALLADTWPGAFAIPFRDRKPLKCAATNKVRSQRQSG